MIIKFIAGFLMALADSVPGVSGGTIVFLLGLYDEFILSLNNIASRDKEVRNNAFKFLVKLGGGWIIGMALAALVITAVFEKNIYIVSSLFLGFIICAIPLIIMEEKEDFVGKYKNIIFLILGAALVVLITYGSLNFDMGGKSYAWGDFGFFDGAYLFIVAMVAISAMVLPGISGSTIMLVFGVYSGVMEVVSGCIKGLFKLDFTYFPAAAVFGFGILVGILSVVKGLKYLLTKHHSVMVYTIVGMMIGSIYSVIMGPLSLETEETLTALSFDNFSWIAFIIGGAVIFGLQGLKKVLK